LPFYYKIAHVPFIVAFPLVVFEFYKKKYKSFKLQKITSFILISILGYLLLKISGIFYSVNIKEGLHHLELLLALVYISSTIFLYNFSAKQIQILINFFSYSVIAGCVFLYIYSFRETDEYVTITKYTYTNLGAFNHPSYYTLLLNSALFLNFYKKWNNFNVYQIIYNVLIIVFLMVFIILFVSKAGNLVMITTLLLGLFWLIQKKYIKPFYSLLILFLLGLILVGAYVYSPINQRVREGVKKTLEDPDKEYTKEMTSTETRKFIWIASLKKIMQKPFTGFGTGSFKKVLFDDSKSEDFKFNAHNQFLEDWFENGIFALIFLSLWLILLGGIHIQSNWFLALFLIVNIFLNLGVETMLSRLAGVQYITIITGFTLHYLQNKDIYHEG
jgi:O-antigen ligase